MPVTCAPGLHIPSNFSFGKCSWTDSNIDLAALCKCESTPMAGIVHRPADHRRPQRSRGGPGGVWRPTCQRPGAPIAGAVADHRTEFAYTINPVESLESLGDSLDDNAGHCVAYARRRAIRAALWVMPSTALAQPGNRWVLGRAAPSGGGLGLRDRPTCAARENTIPTVSFLKGKP